MPLQTTFTQRVFPITISVILVVCGSITIPATYADQPTTRQPPIVAPNTTVAPLGPEGPTQDTATGQLFDGANYLTGDWLGQRQRLVAQGITFDLAYTADGTKNLRGGLDTAGSTWRRMFEATISLDTKPLLGLEGGTLFADFQDAQGPNPSDELIGDVQGIDGLDGVPRAPHQSRTQLAQLWYQQTSLEGTWRVKVGKVDANSEFDSSIYGQPFLHQSTAPSATLFSMPSYPDPAMSVNLFMKPTRELQLGFGIYDGSLAEGTRTGSLGPKTFFRRPDDLFLIGEADQTWKLGAQQLGGRLGVGGWYSTNKFNRVRGGRADGTGGPYALLDQAIWRVNPKDDKDARGINLFVMYGYADPTILFYDHNIGGGVSFAGLIPGRRDDVAGFGLQSIHFSGGNPTRTGYETSYEAFYRLQLRPWLAIQPDLQYIANPGGNRVRDALAATIRFEIHF
jgi:porin